MQRIDAGELDGSLFFNVAGIGLDARIAARMASRPIASLAAPELIARSSAADLDDEKRQFQSLMATLAALPVGSTMAPHPAFGDLSYDEYGALIAKHTDHHLRQFSL